MRIARVAVACCTLSAAAAFAGEPAPKAAAPPSGKAVTDAGARIQLRVSDADLARATAALGKPMMVQHRRCQAGTGKCAEADEKGATERIQLWGARDATADSMLLVTSCRTDAGWKVGRVTVRQEPRKGTPGQVPPLRDDADPAFMRASCTTR